MEIFDNVNRSVRDDFSKVCDPGSRISIAAACFSIYAYQELKEQLEGIEQLRFIFTAQTFTAEKAPKEKREFYIPRLQRERTLYGSEFEVKLRNELSQKAIAKECADWIKQKVTFRSNQTGENMRLAGVKFPKKLQELLGQKLKESGGTAEDVSDKPADEKSESK